MPIESPSISTVKSLKGGVDTAIILIAADKKLGKVAAAVDKELGGILTHHLTSHPKFKADAGQTLLMTLPAKAAYLRVVLLGLGDIKKGQEFSLETAGGKCADVLTANGSSKAAILNGDDVVAAVLPALVLGMRLAAYRFDGYKTVKKEKDADIRLAS
ncbi:MAG: M17 family peptidase N-terminal domain-containing protein [Pseudomonadota bacterium]